MKSKQAVNLKESTLTLMWVKVRKISRINMHGRDEWKNGPERAVFWGMELNGDGIGTDGSGVILDEGVGFDVG